LARNGVAFFENRMIELKKQIGTESINRPWIHQNPGFMP
jgi:hypothetical protein